METVPQWITNSDSSQYFFEVANTLLDLYVSYKGRYVISANGQTFVAKRRDEYLRLDNKAICGHLNHGFAVGVYAGRFCSKFLCFDVDDGSKETVHSIISSIGYAGFDTSKVYVSFSGKKGYHVEMFFDKLMRTNVLMAFYDYICADANLDKNKVEFRPTYSQSIKLPLGVHASTGNVCWYVNQETLEPIEDTQYIFQIQKFNCEDSYKLIRFAVGDDAFFGYQHMFYQEQNNDLCSCEDDGEEFSYPNLTRRHMTHNTIIYIVKHERRKGVEEERLESQLNQWLDNQNPEYLTDPIPKIRKDIHDAVCWAYKRSIEDLGIKELIFTVDEIKLLFERRPRVQRMFLFDIMVNQKKHGSLTMSLERIAQDIGCSSLGVIKAGKTLAENGVIKIEHQKAVKMGDAYRHLPNIYRIVGKVKDPDSIWILTDEVSIADGSLKEMWGELVRQTLRADDWNKYFTKKEIDELRLSEGEKNE